MKLDHDYAHYYVIDPAFNQPYHLLRLALDMAFEPLPSEREDDQDATLVASDGDFHSDGEDFSDVQDHDRDVLECEEAEQSLLNKENRLEEWRHAFTRRGTDVPLSDKSTEWKRRRRDARRRRSQAAADTEVMFEMEGGFKDTSSQSSQESTDLTGPRWASKDTVRLSLLRPDFADSSRNSDVSVDESLCSSSRSSGYLEL